MALLFMVFNSSGCDISMNTLFSRCEKRCRVQDALLADVQRWYSETDFLRQSLMQLRPGMLLHDSLHL
jgi:hypothetical protein